MHMHMSSHPHSIATLARAQAVQQSGQSYCRWDSDAQAQSAVPSPAAALPTATAAASTDTVDLPPSAAEQALLQRAQQAEGRRDGMQALLQEQVLVLSAMRVELASAREAAGAASAAQREAEGRLESRVASLRRQLDRAHAVIADQARRRLGSTLVLDRLQQRLAEADARSAEARRRADSATRMARNYQIASW